MDPHGFVPRSRVIGVLFLPPALPMGPVSPGSACRRPADSDPASSVGRHVEGRGLDRPVFAGEQEAERMYRERRGKADGRGKRRPEFSSCREDAKGSSM